MGNLLKSDYPGKAGYGLQMAVNGMRHEVI
jgi:hypothetical protein